MKDKIDLACIWTQFIDYNNNNNNVKMIFKKNICQSSNTNTKHLGVYNDYSYDEDDS